MFSRHFEHWPPGQPRTIELPRSTVYANLEASVARHPERAAIDYYGSLLSYADLKRQVDALAGFLQQRCGVAHGDRVLLYLQNSPQFVIAYYAIVRADAILEEPLAVRAGFISVPEKPGLGMAWNEEAVKRYLL